MLPFLKHLPFVPPFQDPELRRLLDEIIDRRRAAAAQDKTPRSDLLQILLDAQDRDPQGFPYIDVISEMLVLLVAGSDTPSGTLTFAIMFLLKHPEAYRRVTEEVWAAFPGPESEVTDERTANLSYLTAVLKETLRIMSPTASGRQVCFALLCCQEQEALRYDHQASLDRRMKTLSWQDT